MNNTYNKRILLLPLAVVFVALMAAGVSALSLSISTTPADLIANVNVPKTWQLNISSDTANTTITNVNYAYSSQTWTALTWSSDKITISTTNEDDIGWHTITVNATATVNGVANTQIPSRELTFFVAGENCNSGILQVKNVEVDDVTGDDSEVNPGDYLEITFDIRNSRDLSDVTA